MKQALASPSPSTTRHSRSASMSTGPGAGGLASSSSDSAATPTSRSKRASLIAANHGRHNSVPAAAAATADGEMSFRNSLKLPVDKEKSSSSSSSSSGAGSSQKVTVAGVSFSQALLADLARSATMVAAAAAASNGGDDKSASKKSPGSNKGTLKKPAASPTAAASASSSSTDKTAGSLSNVSTSSSSGVPAAAAAPLFQFPTASTGLSMVSSPTITKYPEVLSDDDDDFGEGAAGSRPKISTVNELIGRFIEGDNVLGALANASTQSLCDFLPAFVSGLVQTPMFLMDYRRKSIAFLNSRARQSLDLAQLIFFFQQSNYAKSFPFLRSIDTGCQAASVFAPLFANQAKRDKGFAIEVPDDVLVCHPFSAHVLVSKIVVSHVFKSNSRPLLLSLHSRETGAPHPKGVIFKVGDDLRQEMAVLQTMRLFNRLWAQEKVRFKSNDVYSHSYSCVSIADQVGFIEFVPNCVPLKDIKKIARELSPVALERLVAHAAGSYMAAAVLGIKDRHDDNILLTKNGEIFHIDFGYILGRKLAGVDTGEFAITRDLADTFGPLWGPFQDTCLRSFAVLRKHATLVCEYIDLLLSPYYPAGHVPMFLRETLMLDTPLGDACAILRKRIESAPSSLKTRLKNVIHGLATEYVLDGDSHVADGEKKRSKKELKKEKKKKERKKDEDEAEAAAAAAAAAAPPGPGTLEENAEREEKMINSRTSSEDRLDVTGPRLTAASQQSINELLELRKRTVSASPLASPRMSPKSADSRRTHSFGVSAAAAGGLSPCPSPGPNPPPFNVFSAAAAEAAARASTRNAADVQAAAALAAAHAAKNLKLPKFNPLAGTPSGGMTRPRASALSVNTNAITPVPTAIASPMAMANSTLPAPAPPPATRGGSRSAAAAAAPPPNQKSLGVGPKSPRPAPPHARRASQPAKANLSEKSTLNPQKTTVPAGAKVHPRASTPGVNIPRGSRVIPLPPPRPNGTKSGVKPSASPPPPVAAPPIVATPREGDAPKSRAQNVKNSSGRVRKKSISVDMSATETTAVPTSAKSDSSQPRSDAPKSRAQNVKNSTGRVRKKSISVDMSATETTAVPPTSAKSDSSQPRRGSTQQERDSADKTTTDKTSTGRASADKTTAGRASAKSDSSRARSGSSKEPPGGKHTAGRSSAKRDSSRGRRGSGAPDPSGKSATGRSSAKKDSSRARRGSGAPEPSGKSATGRSSAKSDSSRPRRSSGSKSAPPPPAASPRPNGDANSKSAPPPPAASPRPKGGASSKPAPPPPSLSPRPSTVAAARPDPARAVSPRPSTAAAASPEPFSASAPPPAALRPAPTNTSKPYIPPKVASPKPQRPPPPRLGSIRGQPGYMHQAFMTSLSREISLLRETPSEEPKVAMPSLVRQATMERRVSAAVLPPDELRRQNSSSRSLVNKDLYDTSIPGRTSRHVSPTAAGTRVAVDRSLSDSSMSGKEDGADSLSDSSAVHGGATKVAVAAGKIVGKGATSVGKFMSHAARKMGLSARHGKLSHLVSHTPKDGSASASASASAPFADNPPIDVDSDAGASNTSTPQAGRSRASTPSTGSTRGALHRSQSVSSNPEKPPKPSKQAPPKKPSRTPSLSRSCSDASVTLSSASPAGSPLSSIDSRRGSNGMPAIPLAPQSNASSASSSRQTTPRGSQVFPAIPRATSPSTAVAGSGSMSMTQIVGRRPQSNSVPSAKQRRPPAPPRNSQDVNVGSDQDLLDEYMRFVSDTPVPRSSGKSNLRRSRTPSSPHRAHHTSRQKKSSSRPSSPVPRRRMRDKSAVRSSTPGVLNTRKRANASDTRSSSQSFGSSSRAAPINDSRSPSRGASPLPRPSPPSSLHGGRSPAKQPLPSRTPNSRGSLRSPPPSSGKKRPSLHRRSASSGVRSLSEMLSAKDRSPQSPRAYRRPPSRPTTPGSRLRNQAHTAVAVAAGMSGSPLSSQTDPNPSLVKMAPQQPPSASPASAGNSPTVTPKRPRGATAPASRPVLPRQVSLSKDPPPKPPRPLSSSLSHSDLSSFESHVEPQSVPRNDADKKPETSTESVTPTTSKSVGKASEPISDSVPSKVSNTTKSNERLPENSSRSASSVSKSEIGASGPTSAQSPEIISKDPPASSKKPQRKASQPPPTTHSVPDNTSKSAKQKERSLSKGSPDTSKTSERKASGPPIVSNSAPDNTAKSAKKKEQTPPKDPDDSSNNALEADHKASGPPVASSDSTLNNSSKACKLEEQKRLSKDSAAVKVSPSQKAPPDAGSAARSTSTDGSGTSLPFAAPDAAPRGRASRHSRAASQALSATTGLDAPAGSKSPVSPRARLLAAKFDSLAAEVAEKRRTSMTVRVSNRPRRSRSQAAPLGGSVRKHSRNAVAALAAAFSSQISNASGRSSSVLRRSFSKAKKPPPDEDAAAAEAREAAAKDTPSSRHGRSESSSATSGGTVGRALGRAKKRASLGNLSAVARRRSISELVAGASGGDDGARGRSSSTGRHPPQKLKRSKGQRNLSRRRSRFGSKKKSAAAVLAAAAAEEEARATEVDEKHAEAEADPDAATAASKKKTSTPEKSKSTNEASASPAKADNST